MTASSLRPHTPDSSAGWPKVRDPDELHASHLIVYDGREQVAWHEQLMAKGGSRIDLDHFRTPGALPLWNRPARPGD